MLNGTTHACIGQEADRRRPSWSTCGDGDHVFSNHRCHGHFLARTGDALGLIAEIMGKPGRRLRRHRRQPAHLRARASSPTASRAASCRPPPASRWPSSSRRPTHISVVLHRRRHPRRGRGLRDAQHRRRCGSCRCWSCSRTTRGRRARRARSTSPATWRARFAAFGIPVARGRHRPTCSSSTRPPARRSPRCARGGGPRVLADPHLPPCHHSKSDDDRPAEEIAARWVLDPLVVHGRRLATPTGPRDRRTRSTTPWPRCVATARALPLMIYATCARRRPAPARWTTTSAWSCSARTSPTPTAARSRSRAACRTDFPQRVRTTPISEGAIAGISAGLALAGYRPIAEIMFGDFLTLCFDQIVNHIAKYRGDVRRQGDLPGGHPHAMGGRRGYGPTHSQSLEKHFLGIPHLRVVAASLVHDPAEACPRLPGPRRARCSTSSTSCSTRST